MGRRHDLPDVLLAELLHRGLVAGEDGGERLLALPLGVLRGKGFDLVQRKEGLRIVRLLDPEGAVVVEHRDAVLLRHELVAPFLRHRGDEIEDGLLVGAVVPGRKRILRHCHRLLCRFVDS